MRSPRPAVGSLVYRASPITITVRSGSSSTSACSVAPGGVALPGKPAQVGLALRLPLGGQLGRQQTLPGGTLLCTSSGTPTLRSQVAEAEASNPPSTVWKFAVTVRHPSSNSRRLADREGVGGPRRLQGGHRIDGQRLVAAEEPHGRGRAAGRSGSAARATRSPCPSASVPTCGCPRPTGGRPQGRLAGLRRAGRGRRGALARPGRRRRGTLDRPGRGRRGTLVRPGRRGGRRLGEGRLPGRGRRGRLRRSGRRRGRLGGGALGGLCGIHLRHPSRPRRTRRGPPPPAAGAFPSRPG